MKTSLKRSTKTYSARSSHNDHSGYDTHNTFCLFPPLVLNPSILLIVSLNQNFHCESCQSRALALITKCKVSKSDKRNIIKP